MKVAFWGLGILVLGLFGILMIHLFGNIAVTNQLNYTTMKNDVEASMYDALDKAYYRSGFCLCTEKEKTNGKWVFNSSSEYELKDIVYVNGKGACTKTGNQKCKILKGEYRLNKKVFIESLMRRLASVINNNKDYKITIKDIIEYPPKVSVRIDSADYEFTPTDDEAGGYTIVNQMDAIIETKNTLPTASPTPAPTAPPVSVTDPEPETPSATTPPGSGSNPVSPTSKPAKTPAPGNYGCGGGVDGQAHGHTNSFEEC